MTTSLISVITPTYKRVYTGELDRCIQSVDAQLDNRYRHIIVGDNCPELESYKKKLEKSQACKEGRRVIINLEKNSNDLGVTPLNHGISIAGEPYYAILADDNVWLPHHLAALLEFIERNKDLYGFVYGNQILKHKHIPEYYRIRVANQPAWNHIDLGDPIYKRELWLKYGPYKYEDRPDIGDICREGGKYSYDWHFIYDCLKGGEQWVHMNFDPSLIWYLDDKSPIKSSNWGHDLLRIGGLPVGDGGVAWYRMKYPLNLMTEKKLAYASYIPQSLTEYNVESWFQNHEVLIFQGVGSFKTADLIKRLKAAQKVCVTDVDDYIKEVDYDNTNYHNIGRKDIIFRFNDRSACLRQLNLWKSIIINEHGATEPVDAQIERVTTAGEDVKDFDLVIHRHGYGGFDVERNLKALAAADECYRQSDGIQTTTEYFAKKLREFNENVFVFPNCLDFKLWDGNLQFVRNDNKIRIVWVGGSSHLGDLMLVRDALVEILHHHPECIFICGGFTPEGFARVFDSKQIEVVPWWDFKEHPFRLHRMRSDIGIIPLRNTEFANCKSPIKWTELSALGVPCVVSNSVVYNTEIEDGKTGFLFDTPKQFIEQMEILINSEQKRREIGQAALEYVKGRFDIEKWTPKLLRWYEGMWLKKNISIPNKNTLTPILKARWEKELGKPINSIKILDGAVY